MKGQAEVMAKAAELEKALAGLAHRMQEKKERAVILGLQEWEWEFAVAVNAFIDTVNAALEKEGRPGVKLTGSVGMQEWEKTE